MESGFHPDSLIEPLGIAAFVCMSITLILGLFIKKNRKKLMPWHVRIGFLTFIIVIVHGSLVLFFH